MGSNKKFYPIDAMTENRNKLNQKDFETYNGIIDSLKKDIMSRGSYEDSVAYLDEMANDNINFSSDGPTYDLLKAFLDESAGTGTDIEDNTSSSEGSKTTSNDTTNTGVSESNEKGNATSSAADALAAVVEGGYGYENIPKYESKYTNKIDELYKRIFGGGNNDAGVRAQDQARVAMRNTLGQAAARTGGMASSYAVGAAMQSYADVYAELERAAAEADAASREADMEELAYLMALDDKEKTEHYEELAILSELGLLGKEPTSDTPYDPTSDDSQLRDKILNDINADKESELPSLEGINAKLIPGIDDQPGEVDINAGIVNQHGDDWVYVHGYGRVSFSELEFLVDNGYVHESKRDDGTFKYTKIK